MAGKRLRIAAAVVALIYVGVQAFQDYVFRTLPAPASPADELMAGAHTLHVVRSTLMLFSMFGLLFIFGVIVLAGARRRPVVAGAAFLSYFVFFLLEIGLRSTELFWIQLQLPAAYAASHDPALVGQMQTFQAVQGALYFPLGFSTLIGSVLMLFLFEVPPARNWVIRVVFAWNVLRIAARQLTGYAGIPLLPGDVYDAIYLPLVVVAFYVPAAWWLWRGARSPQGADSASTRSTMMTPS
jgi:hypothetical protein